MLFSIAVALGGIALGYAAYGVRPLTAGQTDPVERLPFFKFLHNRWYWDDLYRITFVKPMQAIADRYTDVVDRGVIDRVLEGGYALGARVTKSFAEFDRVVITGFSDTVGRIFRAAGDWVRDLQTGQVQNYLLSSLAMALVIIVVFIFLFQ